MRGVATPCTLGQVGQIQANSPLKPPGAQKAEKAREAQSIRPEPSCPVPTVACTASVREFQKPWPREPVGGEAEKAEGAAETF